MAERKTTGDLARYPFARLLLFVLRKQFDGFLTLVDLSTTAPNGAVTDGSAAGVSTVRVFFSAGWPVYCDLEHPEDLLGKLLQNRGMLSETQLAQGLKVQKEGSDAMCPPLGRIAVQNDWLQPEQLVEALRLQLARKVFRLFAWRRGRFSLELGAPPARLAAELDSVRLDPVPLVAKAIDVQYDVSRLNAELSRIAPLALRLKEQAPLSTLQAQLGATQPKKVTLALLNKGYWLLSDLIAASRQSPKNVLGTVCFLWAVDALDMQDPAKVPRLRPKTGMMPAVDAAVSPQNLREVVRAEPPQTRRATPAPAAPKFTVETPVVKPRSAQGSAGQATAGQATAGQAVSSKRAPTETSAAGGIKAGAAGASKTGAAGGSKAGAAGGSKAGAAGASKTGAAGGSKAGAAVGSKASAAGASKASAAAGSKAGAESVDWPPVSADATEAIKGLDRELRERLQNIKTQNLFEVLGIATDASRKEVKDAYLVLAKKFHPDRVASLGEEVLREPADRLFQRISEAFTTLLDDEQRREYSHIVQDTSLAGGREKAQEILRAEIKFQKGEVFFKKGDWSKAEEMFSAAVKGNPDEGEHLAMLAWTRYMKVKKQQGEVSPELHAQVRNQLIDALKLSPKCARAHYFLGKLQLAKGQRDEALRSFERAVAINPNFLDAAREINVMRLRQTRKQKPVKSSFWDRLKGR